MSTNKNRDNRLLFYPKKKQCIQWVTWQPTPYHNYFFEHLAQDHSVNLLVHFLKRVVPTHPWKTVVPDGYKSRFCKMRMGVDWYLIWRGITEKKAFFVIVGWNQTTYILLLSILRILRRNYALWTDTPKPYSKRSMLFAWARTRYLRWIFAGARAVMGTGTHATSILEQMGAPQDHVVNFPTFPNLSALRKRSNHGHDVRQTVRIISVGCITNHVKGHDLAVSALSKVARMGIALPFEYAIAGDGPDVDNLAQLVQMLKLEENIKILGWLEPEEVKAVYQKSDLLIHPSPVHDPYPNAVLDGMAAGLVVFVSDACGQAHERITHGVNGFIHRAGDVEQLATQVAELLQHPERIQEIGKKALETAEQWPVERGVTIIKQIIFSCAAS